MRGRIGPWALALGLLATAGPPNARAADAPAAVVAGVDVSGADGVPAALLEAALADLVGRPRSRLSVRESVIRLWATGLFEDVRVDEVDTPSGLRLRFRLVRRPLIRAIRWQGEPGLRLERLAASARLALGEAATAARLRRAQEDLLALYRREGYLAARVQVDAGGSGADRDVTVRLDPGEPARLGNVRVLGSLGLPREEAVKVLALATEDRYRDPLVRDRVQALERRLRAERFFEARVRVEPPRWDAARSRVDLDVTVEAGPRYRVEVAGARAIDPDVVRSRLTFADAGAVDEFERDASARQIEAAYRERGHAFAEATVTLEPEGDPRPIRVEVTEGPVVLVGSITIRGNVAVPTGRLLEAMRTQLPGLGTAGVFRRDVLDRDLAALGALLREDGFADAVVGPAQVRLEREGTRAEVLIPIVDGPALRVGRVSVEGQATVRAEDLLAAPPFRAGDPWRSARVERGRRAIERLYAARGFQGAVVQSEVTRRDPEVMVRYRVQEGEATRVGRVLVRGLLLTREETVRGQVGLAPGDRFEPDRLLAAQRRLERAPAFVASQVGPLRPPAGPFADVEVDVTEQRPWRVECGLGYDSAEGGRGFFEVGHDNLFGTARSGSMRFKQAIGGKAVERLQRFDLVYREPWLGRTLWRGLAELHAELTENPGYDHRRYGLALTAGIEPDDPARPTLAPRLRYRLESVTTTNVSPALRAAGVVPGTAVVASLTPALAWDRRDDPINPTRGSWSRVSLELASTAFGGTVDFLKGELATAWYFSWLPPTVLALSGRLGLAAPIAGTDALPIEDRFFTGGAASVRGFPERRLGPRDAAGNPVGGNALLVLSAEWRFPLWGWLGGAVFVDSGAVTPEVGDLAPGELRTGTGAGLRLATPVGAVRLDAGYAPQPISGENRWQVYFTIGQPF
jgi:outer membrane protein assembly complex protein YaeT